MSALKQGSLAGTPSQTQLVVLGISGTLWLLFSNYIASLSPGTGPVNVAVLGTGCLMAVMWIGAVATVLMLKTRPRVARRSCSCCSSPSILSGQSSAAPRCE